MCIDRDNVNKKVKETRIKFYKRDKKQAHKIQYTYNWDWKA